MGEKLDTYVIVVKGAVLLDEAQAAEYIRSRVEAVIPEGRVSVYKANDQALADLALDIDVGGLRALALPR